MAREPAPAGSVVDLRGVTQVLRRRRGLILAIAVGMGILTALATFAMPARYQASTKIIFDPRPMQVLQNGLQASSTNSDDTGAEAESQVQVITSADVLKAVIAQLGLERDPDFGAPPPSFVGSLLQTIRDIAGTRAAPPADPKDVALRALQQDITVSRIEKTYILEIKVQTPDIDKSAQIANAVAAAFLKQTVQNRSEAARRSSESLSGRLDELRTRLAKSEQAVEAYRKSHNLVGANGKPVLEQQLADTSNQLMLAQAKRAEQEARTDVIRKAMRSGDSLDAQSEANLSPALTALKEQLAAAQRQKTAAELVFGANHPDRVAANAQAEAARQRLQRESNRLAASAQSDLDRARLSEATLAQHLESLKAANAGANDSLVRLRELDREAASDRSVYEAFLNRAKELQERQTLDTLDARVLTPAVAPLGKSGPSRSVLVLAGTILGCILGLGAALAREQFDGTVRSRQQIAAEVGLPVLATVAKPGDPEDPALWALRDAFKADASARQSRHILLATVGNPALGATIASHLARSSEYEGWSLALVDAAGEQGELTRRMRAEDDAAPTPLDRGATPFWKSLRIADGKNFLSNGDRWSRGLASPREFRSAVDKTLGDGKVVFVYGGSAASVPRMRALASVADEVVLIVEAGRATMDEVSTAVRLFDPGEHKLRGLILAGAIEG